MTIGNRIKQTRFKLVLISLGLATLGAVAKTIFPGFPYVEMLGGIGTIDGLYLGVKTTNNIKEAKYEKIS